MQCYKIFTPCKWVKISFYNIITPRGAELGPSTVKVLEYEY